VLNAHPQLAYALFQAMLLMNVVDPAVLSVSLTISTSTSFIYPSALLRSP
jgi:cleavage stimulation factor subunit 2